MDAFHHRRLAAGAVFLLCLAFPAAAVDVLYRADDRPPAIVFAQGFQARGTNRNVLDHISGLSCYGITAGTPVSDRTAFIGLAEHPGLTLPLDYIYRVTPDARADEFTAAYDVRQGLAYLSAARESLRLDVRQLAVIDRLRQMHISAGTYLARQVPPELVQSVDIYQRNPMTGRRTLIRSERNPGWIMPRETGARAQFAPSMAAALDSRNVVVYYVDQDSGQGRFAIGACHADCARAAKRDVASAAGVLNLDVPSEGVCISEPIFDGRDIFSRTLQVILD